MKRQTYRDTTETFIKKANIIHDDIYDYSLVDYKNAITKINIICSIHGQFSQRPCDHLHQKQGCPKCSHNYQYTHSDFVEKSNKQHDKKYEIISLYKGMKHPITIKCTDHGEFSITKAERHFLKDGCCPTCAKIKRQEGLKTGNSSKEEAKWLDSLAVPIRQHRVVFADKHFIVDGYDPVTNTVYEYYGSYWHGNPAKYNKDGVNTVINKTFGQLYEQTVERESLIKTEYNLVTKWDC